MLSHNIQMDSDRYWKDAEVVKKAAMSDVDQMCAPKECGICNEIFNEDKNCPKILPCCHCLCAICIDQLIVNNLQSCPFCRKEFRALSAKDFGTNFNLLDILKYVNELEELSKLTPARVKGHRSLQLLNNCKAESREISQESKATCRKATERIRSAMQSNSNLKDAIADANRKLLEMLNVIKEVELRNRKHLNYLEEENSLLEKQLMSVSRQEMVIDDAEIRLEAAGDLSSLGFVMDRTEEINNDTKDLVDAMEEFLSKNKHTRENIGKDIEECKRKLHALEEILTSHQEKRHIDLSHGMVAMTAEEDIPEHLTVDYLRRLKEPIKQALKQRKIFAIQNYLGQTRYARITITEGNEICLHHLTEELPPPKAHYIKHCEVMKLVDKSSRRTFLDLRIRQEDLGRLLLKLSPDTVKAQHHALLCTGERGISYANGYLYGVKGSSDDNEWLWFNPDEKRVSSGGNFIFSDMDVEEEWKDVYVRPMVVGAVATNFLGRDTLKFTICLKEKPHEKIRGAFGMVEKGMGLLNSALSRQPNLKEFRIHDCGIVLSHE
ncbi:uncharacterized protein [Macrobrachium rosenbergii]|uniref:uncharacterized protein n=1 Tax=Macrobrachium rosenbergii TaxID=79674 RepID=UPI0034D3A1A1